MPIESKHTQTFFCSALLIFFLFFYFQSLSLSIGKVVKESTLSFDDTLLRTLAKRPRFTSSSGEYSTGVTQNLAHLK